MKRASIRLDNKWLESSDYQDALRILNEEFSKIEAIDYKLNKNGEEIRIFFKGTGLEVPLECPIHTQHKGSKGKFIDLVIGQNKFVMKVLSAHKGEVPVITPIELNGKKLEESEKGFLISDLTKLPEINSGNVEDKARLYYSEDQYKAIRYNTKKEEDGFAHIEGPAGSGKSTVALHRAFIHVQKMWEEEKDKWKPTAKTEKMILLTSYSAQLADSLYNSMCKLIQIEAERLELGDDFIEFADQVIMIVHYHGFLDCAYPENSEWSSKVMKTINLSKKSPSGDYGSEAEGYNKTLLENAKAIASEKHGKHLFFQLLPDVFYFELFNYCLLQREMSFEDFRDLGFHNQHVQFQPSDREIMWSIFENYRDGLLNHKKKFSYAARSLSAKPRPKGFRYIIVDEAQDFTKGEIEFLILNLGSYQENSNLNGMTLLSDPTQSIFNPYFYPGEVLPLSVHKEMKRNNISGSKRFFLKTSYRNPKSILKAAEHLKKKIRLTKQQNDKEEYAAKLIKQDFRQAKIHAPAQSKPNFKWQELTTSGSTTIYKSKGQEYKDVYLKDFSMGHMFYDLRDCLREVAKNCQASELDLNNAFFDVLAFSLHQSTSQAHTASDEAFKKLIHGKVKRSEEDEVLRLMRYLITYHDKILKLLYVALTRTQGNFAYGLQEYANKKFKNAVNDLFLSLSDISLKPTDMEEAG